HRAQRPRLIVVGAGQAGTLGAMWMANECRRKRDKNSGQIGLPRAFDDPESKDLACGVWLTPSPTLEGRNVPILRWLMEAAVRHKVPVGFVVGKTDEKNAAM